MTWQCKRHGKGCQSYVVGFCYDLNMAGVQPHEAKSLSKKNQEDKILLGLVEWVEAKE